jgi:5-methylcytosine-specific restriction endonuclease McrA
MNDILASKVLVLNRLYRPIGVITARDAFVKLYIEIAEVVTVENGSYSNYDFNSWADISDLREKLEELGDLDDVVYTERLTLIVPRVIRLIKYDRMPKQTLKLTRRNVYIRDENTCQYCGKKLPTDKLNIDHVVPKSQGGKNTWENLVCSCFNCNSKKAGKTPVQARMKLKKPALKPKFNPALKVHISSRKYEAWTSFISESYWNIELEE